MFVRSAVCHLSSSRDVVSIWGLLDVLIMGIQVAVGRCIGRSEMGRRDRCLDRVQRLLSGSGDCSGNYPLTYVISCVRPVECQKEITDAGGWRS